MLEDIIYSFFSLTPLGYVRLFFDIYLIWIVFYLLLNLIKLNVRTLQLLKGVLFVLFLHFISRQFQLEALRELVGEVMTFAVLVVFIIFQPELRSALEQIGINAVKATKSTNEDNLVATLCASIDYLAKRRIGALIVIEKEIKLDEFISTGTVMNSQLSFELLNTIFVPTTPLHDGAVILRESNIYCAGAYLPLTTREDINKELGTRHRAAIGGSEITDAIFLTVSEETGKMSIARHGRITRFEDIDSFKLALQSYTK